MAATNAPKTSAEPVTFLEAIKQAMFEEMERDPAVVVIGEDVGVYGGAFKTSEGLLERFGWERVIDTPISESAIIGAACGMSYLGLRPICEMQFIDFIACLMASRNVICVPLVSAMATSVPFSMRRKSPLLFQTFWPEPWPRFSPRSCHCSVAAQWYSSYLQNESVRSRRPNSCRTQIPPPSKPL